MLLLFFFSIVLDVMATNTSAGNKVPLKLERQLIYGET